MKKAFGIITLALLIHSGSSFSQSSYRSALQKGSVLANGNLALSFGRATSDYYSQFGSNNIERGYTSITVSPKAGFLVANGLMFGVAVDLNSQTVNHESSDSKTTLMEYTVGPVVRFYAPGGFFVHSDVAFGKNIEKSSNGSLTERDKANVFKWQLGVGYALFLNNHVAIEPNFSYRKSQTKGEIGDGEFKGGLGEFVIGVGFSIFLHRGGE
jgi:outer membrane protein